jgi:hypothetical protein
MVDREIAERRVPQYLHESFTRSLICHALAFLRRDLRAWTAVSGHADQYISTASRGGRRVIAVRAGPDGRRTRLSVRRNGFELRTHPSVRRSHLSGPGSDPSVPGTGTVSS